MPFPRVTGVVWWEMGISHYKAIFRRARHGEAEAGYTKDYLQGPRESSQAFRAMFGGVEPPYEPITYVWPDGVFEGGKIYPAADYEANMRVEVGQWTGTGAPHPWQLGDPDQDPLITFRGDPDAGIPSEADAQWEQLEEHEPWLLMVQLDDHQSELHLRAYLAAPPPDLVRADLETIPGELRGNMRGRGGLVTELPQLWFDPADYRDPWRLSADGEPGVDAWTAPAPGESVGGSYQPANETASSTEPEPFEVDPDERDRSTRAHSLTQNKLAAAVEERGLEPRSPSVGEPNYDIAWEELDGTLIVGEVKSIKPQNAEKQLRLALGQVLRYRSLLAEAGRPVRSVIALSAEPHDGRWVDLCAEHDTALVWLPDLATGISDWLDSS